MLTPPENVETTAEPVVEPATEAAVVEDVDEAPAVEDVDEAPAVETATEAPAVEPATEASVGDAEVAPPVEPVGEPEEVAPIAVTALSDEPPELPAPLAPAVLVPSVHPLEAAPIHGDPGRQKEIVASLGPLTIGVPDTALDFSTVEPFEIRACSTRGLSHRYAGTPRQDSYAIAANDDWLILAVTDGVSQGHYSHVAAELVARGACKLLADADSETDVDWQQISVKLSTRIVEEARIRGLARPKSQSEGVDQVREVKGLMSTTAVVARLRRTPNADGNLAGQLAVLAGDSGAYRIADGEVTVLLGGKDGDSMISSTQVRPLPGAVEPDVVDFELGPGQAVMLTTDGIGDTVGDGDSDVGRILAEAWATPPTIDAFLLQTNFFRKTFDDDRTALVAWNTTAPR